MDRLPSLVFLSSLPHGRPSLRPRECSYLSYAEDQREGHPPGKEVMLQLMPIEGGKSRVLAKFTGGQGTINTASTIVSALPS